MRPLAGDLRRRLEAEVDESFRARGRLEVLGRRLTVEQTGARREGEKMRGYFAALVAASVMGCGAALAADLPAAPAPIIAPAPPPPPSGWQFTATIPIWMTALDGTVGVGRLPSSSVNISAIDALKSLKAALAFDFIAHNDTFIFGLDFMWAKTGGSSTFKANGNGPFAALRTGTTASYTQNSVIGTAFAGYRLPLAIQNVALYGTVGARYTGLGLDLNLSRQGLPPPFPGGFSIDNSANRQWVDPVIGLAGKYRIDDKWYIDGYGDIGGFGLVSKITTEDTLAVGYNWTQNIATSLGFKLLYDNYQHDNGNGGSFRYNMLTYGPVINLSLNF